MDDALAEIQQSLQTQLAAVTSRKELDSIEVEFLGRKGKINALFSQLKKYFTRRNPCCWPKKLIHSKMK
ncbi:MAG: hypothetical protein UZ22_OP11002000558 [Microgenomates bacterium OLB23]|nr:MAG: hypothetical protein UZ22_OP11002000558 [Microgenomates bacterium OLB23]